MKLRSVVRRAGWGLGDQAFSSLTNFALGVLIARAVSARSFGAFAVAFATYTLALGASRALVSEPFVVRLSAAPADQVRASARDATGTAFVVGTVTGLGCIVAGLLSDGDLRAALFALGVVLPGLLVQDAWRYVFFAWGRGGRAMANDVAWAAFMFPAVLALTVFDQGEIGWLVLAWGGAATGAAVVGGFQARCLPSPLRARAWLRVQRDLAPSYLGEFGAMSGARQLPTFVVGGAAGLTEAGALRAANMILGPLHIFFMGIRLVAVPEAVRMLSRSLAKMRASVRVMAGALSATSVVWGLVILVLPDTFGRAMLGETWTEARPVIVPMTVYFAGGAWSMGALVGLRALAAAKRSLRARIWVSIFQTAGGVTGAAVAGASGAAWGLAVAVWLGAMVWWAQFRVALTEHAPVSPQPPADPDTDVLVDVV